MAALRNGYEATEMSKHIDTSLKRGALQRIQYDVEALLAALSEPVQAALRPLSHRTRVGHVLVRHTQVVMNVVALLLRRDRAEDFEAMTLRDLNSA